MLPNKFGKGGGRSKPDLERRRSGLNKHQDPTCIFDTIAASWKSNDGLLMTIFAAFSG